MNLISAGQTNADIATSLYLSPKTVEHHVTAILRKLNASSRVEAAAKFAALSKTGGSTRPNRG